MRDKQNRKRWDTRVHRDCFDALCKIVSMEIHIYFHLHILPIAKRIKI